MSLRRGNHTDTIVDFVAGAGTEDKIDLTAVAGIHTFADVVAHATDDGVNTTINLGGSDSIILSNVVVSQLHHDDFVLA